MVFWFVWASAAFICQYNVLAWKGLSNTSHHWEIKVITQPLWGMFHAFSSSHYRLLHWSHCFLLYTTLFWLSACVSNLVSYNVYESSDKMNSFFILCLAQYFKLLLKNSSRPMSNFSDTTQHENQHSCYVCLCVFVCIPESNLKNNLQKPQYESPLKPVKGCFHQMRVSSLFFPSPSLLKGEWKVPKSVVAPEVNRVAAKFNTAELARVCLFSFKRFTLLLGLLVFSFLLFQSVGTQTHSKNAPQFRLMGVGVASRQTSFVGWFMRRFMGFFFYNAVYISNTALLPLRNGTAACFLPNRFTKIRVYPIINTVTYVIIAHARRRSGRT